MKKGIHPQYNDQAVITCACGNSFTVGSTKQEIRVELCNMCHPFYTGKQKFVDTARRVEKFQEKVAKTKAAAGARKGKKAKRAIRAKKKQDTGSKATTAPKAVSKKKKAPSAGAKRKTKKKDNSK